MEERGKYIAELTKLNEIHYQEIVAVKSQIELKKKKQMSV